MSNVHQVAFTCTVQPTHCPCHPNQFIAIVWAVVPGDSREPCGGEYYPTEAAAEEDVMRLTEECGRTWLIDRGVRPESIESKVRVQGTAAVSEMKKFMRENDPNLN